MIVKSGDTHSIQWKANLDLTGATVRLVAKPRNSDTAIVLPSTITDAVEGVVAHKLTGTLEKGTYSVELEVTKGADVITFPNSGYSTLTVTPDLD
ncbi:hypothetical protein [Microbacterium sp. W4I20]|uniref:hypothetical protein n=1 Tax=Microbacterium sp. W4I20 TaxID=3042262 RepID=UPI00277FAEF4|nr:hypothetical protein [Microbacterium sp. W4I20]MDQ0726794.1 hypothetical protein [Microbacterium sp. W4I20]